MAKPLILKTARSAALDHGVPYKAILDAINSNELRTVTLGRRPLIPQGAIDDFIRRRTTIPEKKQVAR